MIFFERVGFSSGPDFLETKNKLGAVFVSKSKGCFIMKKVTYRITIIISKHMDYREKFFVRKINIAYNGRILYDALGSCMVYGLVC